MIKRKRLAQLLGLELAFVLLWNSGFIAAEYGLPNTGAWTLLFWRYLALSTILGVWLIVRGRPRWPGLRTAGQMGVVGVLAHGVWLACVLVPVEMGVPVGIVALVTALQPLMTGAFAGPVLGERTSRWQWIGLLLGFAGVAVAVGARLSADAASASLGYLIPFGSVVGITIASLLQRKWAREETGPTQKASTSRSEPGTASLSTVLFYQSAATTVALLLPAWLAEDFATTWTAPFVGAMAWLVLGVSLGAYACMWALLARQDATRVASLFYLSPPVTMLMAWLAFDDQLISTDVVGLVVAAAGVGLVYGRNAQRSTTSPVRT